MFRESADVEVESMAIEAYVTADSFRPARAARTPRPVDASGADRNDCAPWRAAKKAMAAIHQGMAHAEKTQRD
jgi:hypothetical protein